MFAKFYPVSMIRFIEMFDLFLFPLALAWSDLFYYVLVVLLFRLFF
jgi:hypothetical protein